MKRYTELVRQVLLKVLERSRVSRYDPQSRNLAHDERRPAGICGWSIDLARQIAKAYGMQVATEKLRIDL
jgi:hypothetical protein